MDRFEIYPDILCQTSVNFLELSFTKTFALPRLYHVNPFRLQNLTIKSLAFGALKDYIQLICCPGVPLTSCNLFAIKYFIENRITKTCLSFATFQTNPDFIAQLNILQGVGYFLLSAVAKRLQTLPMCSLD